MTIDSSITNELSKLTSTDYPLFADYCNLLDKGFRKDAIKCLDNFIDHTQNWDYTTKAAFCKTLFSVSKTSNDLDFILKHSLVEKLVKPTLLELTIQEPKNYIVFKWYGQYFGDTTFIKKAHELNPSDNSIKLILLNRLEYIIWTSVHHLPDGYLGKIEEDENDLNLAFSLLENLDTEMTRDLFNRFTEYKNAIEIYKQNKPSH
jgi:hypothetical protein